MQPLTELAFGFGQHYKALPALYQFLLYAKQLRPPDPRAVHVLCLDLTQQQSHQKRRHPLSKFLPHTPCPSQINAPAAFSVLRGISTSSSSTADASGGSSDSKSGSQHQQSPHALLASKCRVLPFSLDRSGAELQWGAHHAGVFTAHPGGWAGLKSALLPFWCFGAEVHVRVTSAQIGHTHLTSRYNRTTRRYEPHIETVWTAVYPNWSYARRWSAESHQMQVYGGSKYRHDPALDQMKPGEYVRQALTYGDYVHRSGGDKPGAGGVVPDRMIPFRMSPDEAANIVRQQIRAAELKNAEEQLLQAYGGDRVQLVVMDVTLASFAATPVFSPVWVFKTKIRGTALRTYVAAFKPGLSSGPRLPNPARVAVAAATAAPLALTATGLLAGASLPAALLLGVALPWAVGYGVASFWPELHATFLRVRASMQRPLPDVRESEQEQWWRYEWVRQDTDDYGGYSYSDDARYSHSNTYSRGRRQQQQQQEASGGYTGGYGRRAGAGGGASSSGGSGRSSSGAGGGDGSPGDHRGYYRALGVSPGCSKEEVQAAFRAAAMKWHPDRQPDPALKAESTRRFQAVQEAYSVLRDPARRAAYDRA